MTRLSRTAVGSALAIALCSSAPIAAPQETVASPLKLTSSRISIAGTSNIHAYTASTSAMRVVRLQLATGALGVGVGEELLKPGAIEAFEIAIPASTLSSPKEGLDKNMHKALKVTEHPDITFRLIRVEPKAGEVNGLRGIGVLRIAGVEREVTLDLTTARKGAGLSVQGEVQLLMTDFGIKPPTAMLGMLKTDPKVTVTFETTLTIPLT